MVRIDKMQSQRLDDVIKLRVGDNQQKFVGAIDDILTMINAQIRPQVILVDDQVVGFFLIDTIYKKTNDFVAPQSLGLRKFFIDKQYQGKGYAKQVLHLLPSYLTANYPNHFDIYLTVNCKNDSAKSLYLKSGFQDTNALYLDGPSGPQHVMKLAYNVG